MGGIPALRNDENFFELLTQFSKVYSKPFDILKAQNTNFKITNNLLRFDTYCRAAYASSSGRKFLLHLVIILF